MGKTSVACAHTHEAVEATTKLSAQYINDRFLLDKANDLLEKAGSCQRVAESLEVQKL